MRLMANSGRRTRAGLLVAMASMALATPSVAGAAAGQPSFMHRIAFAQAPGQVQRDLIKTLATCGEPAKLVRSLAAFDIGPIGGPGRKDYFFESVPGIGDGRVSICTGNYVWQRLWTDMGGGRYRMLTQTNNVIFIKQDRSLLFNVNVESNCNVPGARGWSDDGRFWEWEPRAAAFRPVTRCMLLKDAETWAKARGYAEAESY
jgi:hypothetical protein